MIISPEGAAGVRSWHMESGMTDHRLSLDPLIRSPKRMPPPTACDCHFHVFGPSIETPRFCLATILRFEDGCLR